MYFWCILAVLFGLGYTSAEDVRLLELPPEEAQQYIENKDQTLKYAPKIESNVPALRVLGKTPTNVLEDIYLANQYHGQDGIGGYLYGYSVPDIAKTEKKKPQGDLKGAYQYINGDGQEIKVQYWDDGTGFHQVDNLPDVLPKQVEDSPDVQAAKEEFFKRWNEEAVRNTQLNPELDEFSSQQQYQSGYTGTPQSGRQDANYPSSNLQNFTPYLPQDNQGQYQPQPSTPKQYQTGQVNQGGYQPGGQLNQGQSIGVPTGPGGYQPGKDQSNDKQGQATYQTSYNNGQGQSGQPGIGQESYLSGGQLNQGQSIGVPTGPGGYQPGKDQSNDKQGQATYQTSYNYGQGQSGQPGIGQKSYLSRGQLNQEQSIGVPTGPGGYQPGKDQSNDKQGQATYQTSYNNGQGQPGIGQESYISGQAQTGQNCCGGGGNSDYSGQPSSNQNAYSYHQAGKEWEYKKSPDEYGPPRGFFYNFDYPVGIIVQKQGATGGVQKRESLQTVYAENKANFDHQVRVGRNSDGSSQSAYQVHL